MLTGTSPDQTTVARVEPETTTLGLSMALAACLLGISVEINHGLYDVTALWYLTATIVVCAIGIALPQRFQRVPLPTGVATAGVLIAVFLQVAEIKIHNFQYFAIVGGSSLLFGLVCLQLLPGGAKLRLIYAAILLGLFSVVASRAFLLNWADPKIDVHMFQQWSSDALLHVRNPYAMRYPSLQPFGTPFYGRGVVDANNWLTYGFPYPPWSLLMVLPGYVLGGDIRYADVAAVVGTVALMVAARPGRWAALVGSLFLLTPRVYFVVERSWTEPLLALTFSFVMFSHLRWRRALPYALGLFFATKQYTILAVPLVWFLTEGPDRWAEYRSLMLRAISVALAVTLPFFLWNPNEFVRAIVEYQFVQPFRRDALSYLVLLKEQFPEMPVRNIAVFYSVLPATAFAFWRCTRTAAGFAAGVTLVFLLFFAFNKQAFANYYYFVLATACWTAVVSSVSTKDWP